MSCAANLVEKQLDFRCLAPYQLLRGGGFTVFSDVAAAN